jgi:hypothetical protein
MLSKDELWQDFDGRQCPESQLIVVRSDGASQDLQSGLQGIDEGLV